MRLLNLIVAVVAGTILFDFIAWGISYLIITFMFASIIGINVLVCIDLLASFITLFACLNLANYHGLTVWYFIPFGFAMGPIVIVFLLIYPWITLKNKKLLYERTGITAGMMFLCLWLYVAMENGYFTV